MKDLVEQAEIDYPQWKEFAEEYCHIRFYRVLFPGVMLSQCIHGFVGHAKRSLSPLVKEKAAEILKKYSELYRHMTTYPWDETAPIKEGDIDDLKRSVAHFKKETNS